MNIELQWLYKYRPDDIYTIKLLCEQRLHFSHPSDFNDPFDCLPPCSVSFSEEMIMSYMTGKYPLTEAALRRNMPLIKAVINDKNMLQPEVNRIFNKAYICCFSYNATSSLMWAHYTNNHAGLCLGFNPCYGGSYITNCTPKIVEYVEERKVLDFSKELRTQVDQIYSQKYSAWQYEKEVRIIKAQEEMIINDELQNKFEKKGLVEMFFGLKMPQERQDFYKLLCKQCGLDNVKFYKMTLPTNGAYHLVPKEIEEN